jgi:hypothetical protein
MGSEDASKTSIDTQIHVIRGVSVKLDSALASLYGVSVKVLLQAVRRNRKRLPTDFIFQLTNQEVTNLRSQFVTSSLASALQAEIPGLFVNPQHRFQFLHAGQTIRQPFRQHLCQRGLPTRDPNGLLHSS